MKKALLIMCVILTLCACGKNGDGGAESQNFYSVYEKYNVVGNGIYIVGNGGKYGIADSKSGKVYIDLDYDRLEKIDENRILAAKDGHYSLLSSLGALLKDLGDYGNIRVYFNDGEPRLLTYNDGYYTLLSADGAILCDLGQFDHLMLDDNSNDRFVIQRGNLYTIIDENGDKISDLGRYDELAPVFENNAFIVSKGGKKGVINASGTPFISITHEDLWKAKKNSCYVVSDNGLLGAFSPDGTKIADTKYNRLEGYELLFAASCDGAEGIIATDGTVIAPFEYGEITITKSDAGQCTGEMKKNDKNYSFTYSEGKFDISEQ